MRYGLLETILIALTEKILQNRSVCSPIFFMERNVDLL